MWLLHHLEVTIIAVFLKFKLTDFLWKRLSTLRTHVTNLVLGRIPPASAWPLESIYLEYSSLYSTKCGHGCLIFVKAPLICKFDKDLIWFVAWQRSAKSCDPKRTGIHSLQLRRVKPWCLFYMLASLPQHLLSFISLWRCLKKSKKPRSRGLVRSFYISSLQPIW